jgi:hypothetical protein
MSWWHIIILNLIYRLLPSKGKMLELNEINADLPIFFLDVGTLTCQFFFIDVGSRLASFPL